MTGRIASMVEGSNSSRFALEESGASWGRLAGSSGRDCGCLAVKALRGNRLDLLRKNYVGRFWRGDVLGAPVAEL
jgi:hypothetical protein